LTLDSLISIKNLSSGEDFDAAMRAAIRTLASGKWTQRDDELLLKLESDDSKWRVFALHVLRAG
jgi:hypothetical protein